MSVLAHRVILRQCSSSVAFGAKRYMGRHEEHMTPGSIAKLATEAKVKSCFEE